MKRLELWRWRYFDPVRKRHVTTGFVLSEADAALQYPEVRNVPETDAERMQPLQALFSVATPIGRPAADRETWRADTATDCEERTPPARKPESAAQLGREECTEAARRV